MARRFESDTVLETGLLRVALPALAAHHGVRLRGVPGEDAPSPGVMTRE
ncbi:hypothetical protein AB0D62_34020 [Streptomyces massasporeus]